MEEIYESLLNCILESLNNNALTNDRILLDDNTPALQRTVVAAIKKAQSTGDLKSIIGLMKMCEDHINVHPTVTTDLDADITVTIINKLQDI